MRKRRNWINSRLGAAVGLAAGLLLLAAVTVGQAAAEPRVKGQAVEKSVQGQQLCPATPGTSVCQVILDCPAIQAPGKTVCKATIDCPPPKQAGKQQKKPKSD